MRPWGAAADAQRAGDFEGVRPRVELYRARVGKDIGYVRFDALEPVKLIRRGMLMRFHKPFLAVLAFAFFAASAAATAETVCKDERRIVGGVAPRTSRSIPGKFGFSVPLPDGRQRTLWRLADTGPLGFDGGALLSVPTSPHPPA